jgi:rubrerythrin
VCVIENNAGYLHIKSDALTPAQAIAATVGAGMCQIETTENWLPAERYHRCKHCGAFFAVLNASHDIPPHVCPNCGRRVEVGE